MRLSFGLVFSILFHASLACIALYWVSTPSVRVNMDRPVYTVDLLSLASPPAEVPVVAPEPEAVPQAQAPVVEAEAPAPVEVKAAPVVEAKPEPKPEPKPEEISPKKVDSKKIVKKEEKPKDKPKEKPKPAPKPKKTAEQLLAEGLAAAKAEAKKEEQRKAQALTKELAALKKQEGAQVYAHGGQPGGQAGGVSGGAGSGLSEVYVHFVSEAIKKNWRFPAFAGETNLLATIEITLDSEGKILFSKVIDSSGNAGFDNSALQAIKETEYVDRPKTERDRVIRINFNSQELSE